MTEKDKMLAGMIYDANNDPGLIAERMECKELCRDYNDLRPRETEARDALLRKILGDTGTGLLVEQPFYCDYGYNIRVGDNFYANFNLVILDEAPVTFGDNVFIAPNCGFYTAGHPIDAAERKKGLSMHVLSLSATTYGLEPGSLYCRESLSGITALSGQAASS